MVADTLVPAPLSASAIGELEKISGIELLRRRFVHGGECQRGYDEAYT
jgi:hypothetical protein